MADLVRAGLGVGMPVGDGPFLHGNATEEHGGGEGGAAGRSVVMEWSVSQLVQSL